ncbi:carboxymuconolactone decarboxylase family protein [Mucilaginibacter sp. SP1R1]|uniref:carboxymuconolactone decarboxylase family protein n=1 Tax=Mucilaginibacter sp. SP1R1 TaxID=2723091 RepID=UPI001609A090|nr:peroxidase-related enzyme [Mucilaginibacter sp. SP1R1]MBB6147896.1 putative peroxidase-related enzyme [Mucilaginibacter sp. SP1R1]
MPHIPLDENLPGITGLLNYRLDTALPIRQLTQILLRGESTLTEGERELIATVVSNGNQCRFCTNAHTAAANVLLGETETAEKVKNDPDNAPVSQKMKYLLEIARQTQINGKNVTPQLIEQARAAGATDLEIHDTVLIAALFSLYNRYVDGLASVTPTDPDFYNRLAGILKTSGYLPSANRYAALKADE